MFFLQIRLINSAQTMKIYSLLPLLLLSLCANAFSQNFSANSHQSALFPTERSGIITFEIDLSEHHHTKSVNLWLPYPRSDKFQKIEKIAISGDYDHSAIYNEPENGAHYLFSHWSATAKSAELKFQFKAQVKQRAKLSLQDKNLPVPVEISQYLESSTWLPTDGEIAQISTEITQGKHGILEKARAVYDWVVEHTHRDPDIIGCGTGIVEKALARRGGKCADISSVFVALARASGVPAREVFGLRLGKKAQQDMTSGHHCWAEFYLPGNGWVAVDPADVRKIILVKKLSLAQAKPYQEYYFGSVDPYRLVLEKGGRGITFNPKQKEKALNYFMYPYAEVDGKKLNYFDAKGFSYTIQFEEIADKN